MSLSSKRRSAERRVVITGIGLISPLGIGTEKNWQAVSQGKNGIGLISHFDASQFTSKIAGQVKD
ncbi:MAG: hypothetical protein GQ536_09900, partial [Candidatus Aminicenantes bacterium]|nr:hypothetical protein [Candidatus Aminicenantes bacterium]